MIFDFIPKEARAAGLEALMKGAGKFTRYIPIPQPTLLVGPNSSIRLGELVSGFGHSKVMIVTDNVISKLGLLTGIQEAIYSGGVSTAVFDEITPDAPIPLIERGIAFCEDHACDAIVAFGGGSSMDAAKAIAIAIPNGVPHSKPLRSLAGYLKGRSNPLPIYAVPTTAGTGSEVTVAAVISDPAQQSKVVIVDPRLVPKMAALDPTLMIGLPAQVTAATGIDALTHAVEAFVGNWATPTTDGLALTAVGLIFDHLRICCREGGNLVAREKMALASTYAGLAFTRANVGYVHAIAHQFGGRYHTPHGLANAIMLPHVLRFSQPAIIPQLAKLAVRAKIGEATDTREELAEKFIEAVEQLNSDLGIPPYLEKLQEADIPALAKAAIHEAHTGYPVPRYMTQKQCEDIIRRVLPQMTKANEEGATYSSQTKKVAVKKITAKKAAASKAAK